LTTLKPRSPRGLKLRAAMNDQTGPCARRGPAAGRGAGHAAAIAEIVQTGRSERLERLLGAAEPEAVFRATPGIGARLAQRLRKELGIEALDALEVAAHDGRLGRMPGHGPPAGQRVVRGREDECGAGGTP
jgi:DNA polymerase/3'-5' exonuclease PolX